MGVFRYRRVFPCVGNFDIIILVFLFDPDGTAVFVLMIYRKREKSYFFFFFFCHARLLEDREISAREREREVGHPWLSIISSLEFGREREHTRRNKKPEGTKNWGGPKKKNIRWGIYSPWGGSGGDSRWERNAFVFTWISSYIDALHLRLMFLAFRTNLNFPPCFSLNSLIWSDCIISWTECALVFPLNQVTYSRLLSLFFSKIGSSLWRGSLEKVSWLYSTTISIYRSKVSDRISLGSSGGVHTAGF